jgi:hypothetical protein
MCDAELGIITIPNIGRPMAKCLAITGASSALLRPETHYASIPGSERGLGRDGYLARYHHVSRLSELS